MHFNLWYDCSTLYQWQPIAKNMFNKQNSTPIHLYIYVYECVCVCIYIYAVSLPAQLKFVVGWFLPAPTLASCSLSYSAGWGQNRRQARRFMDWDNNTLIRKAKAAQETKTEKGILSVLPNRRQMSSYCLGSRAPECITVAWEDKDHSHFPSSYSFPQDFYCWAWQHRVRNITLVSLGQLSQLCSLPTSHPPPAYLFWQGMRWRKPWPHASCVQQQIKDYLSTVF